jgi:hypothetical protein
VISPRATEVFWTHSDSFVSEDVLVMQPHTAVASSGLEITAHENINYSHM